MTTITAKQLEDLGACADQVAKFRARYGEEAPATVEAAVAVALEFDWDWIAARTLKSQAWRVYDRAALQAWETYLSAERRAWEVYAAAVRDATRGYRAAELWGARDAASRQALGVYNVARARVFAELYIAQEQDGAK